MVGFGDLRQFDHDFSRVLEKVVSSQWPANENHYFPKKIFRKRPKAKSQKLKAKSQKPKTNHRLLITGAEHQPFRIITGGAPKLKFGPGRADALDKYQEPTGGGRAESPPTPHCG
jgi:hypothetical protein